MNVENCKTILVLLATVVIEPAMARAQVLYWGNTAGLYRASMNGSIQELVRARQTEYPAHAVLDPDSGTVYWRGTNIHALAVNGIDHVIPANTGFGRMAFDRLESRIYWEKTWLGPSQVWSMKIDGTDTQPLPISNLGSIYSMSVDPIGSKLYWSEFGSPWIRRVSLEGGIAEDFVLPQLAVANDLAIDPTGNYVYWSNHSTGWIQRAALDSGMIESVVHAGSGLNAFALHAVEPSLYWFDSIAIYRANADGSDGELVSSAPFGSFSRALVDPTRELVFGLDLGTGHLIRQGFDGSGRRSVVSTFHPGTFAIDSVGRSIYWSQPGQGLSGSPGRFERCSLNGKDAEFLYHTYQYGPVGFDLDEIQRRIFWTAWRIGDIALPMRIATSGFEIAGFSLLPDAPPPNTTSYGAIAHDPVDGKLYWTSSDYVTGTKGILQRGSNSHSTMSVLIPDVYAVDLRIESDSRKLYWTDGIEFIMRANLDGTEIEPAVETIYPRSLALDSDRRMMYWTAQEGIFRADLDGSNDELIIPGTSGYLQFDNKTICDSNADSRLDLRDFAALTRCYSPDSATYADESCALLEIDVPDGRIDAYEIKWATASMTGP